MVSLQGTASVSMNKIISGGLSHAIGERPPDPRTLLNSSQLEEKAKQLMDWLQGKHSVFCITGAGMSTDSGIPDYRGTNGSYHKGHQPLIHQQFMESEYNRKRYWGRSMVGWSAFSEAQPNQGHLAMAELEQMNILGVRLEDKPEFYESHEVDNYYDLSSGERYVSIVTQNVDSLHERAGSRDVIPLHGSGNIVKCMQCGRKRQRKDFYNDLVERNQEWLVDAMKGYDEDTGLRPDGDAQLHGIDYNHLEVPNCPHCKTGFYKTDVVYFGDTVPKNRVALCQAAVDATDGILVVGSSLAVHSAYRHVRAASARGVPVAVLNVGETRAETEGLEHILKIEAPVSDTLALCAQELSES